jgi:hypothetical protein
MSDFNEVLKESDSNINSFTSPQKELWQCIDCSFPLALMLGVLHLPDNCDAEVAEVFTPKASQLSGLILSLNSATNKAQQAITDSSTPSLLKEDSLSIAAEFLQVLFTNVNNFVDVANSCISDYNLFFKDYPQLQVNSVDRLIM